MSSEIILNATQHAASIEQNNAGVQDMSLVDQEFLHLYLTFATLPSKADISERVTAIIELAFTYCRRGDRVMIGGAPYLMSALEQGLKDAGYQPVYAFSQRESVEETLADGSVRKSNIFRHLGFVEA